MRRLIYTLLLATAVLTTACQTDDGENRDASLLGKTIWNESKIDIEFICDALIHALNINTVLNTADPQQRMELIERYYGSVEFTTSEVLGVYCLRNTNGSYTSYNTANKPLGEGEWVIKRHSGTGYNLTITPMEDGTLKATFNSLHITESSGSAVIIFTYEYKQRDDYRGNYLEAYISYEGTIVTVDNVSSETKPITLTIKTNGKCNHCDNHDFGNSHYQILCHDALYNCTDEILVDIYASPNKRAEITCYGEFDVYPM
ncbi:MAG: hypothetical protein IKU93_02690 [Alistipes sp.]|nr:hypothetical protein [Alistipes sp.]